MQVSEHLFIKKRIVPISFDNGNEVNILLVFGLNQLRVYGDKLRMFIELLSSQVQFFLPFMFRFYRHFLVQIAEKKNEGKLKCLQKSIEQRLFSLVMFLTNSGIKILNDIEFSLRTPLTLMLGPLEELISHGSISAKEELQLSMIHRNALRLLKLVNTLLDFSRIEAGRIQSRKYFQCSELIFLIVYEPCDIAAFTSDIASVFRAACEQAGISLIVKLDKTECILISLFYLFLRPRLRRQRYVGKNCFEFDFKFIQIYVPRKHYS